MSAFLLFQHHTALKAFAGRHGVMRRCAGGRRSAQPRRTDGRTRTGAPQQMAFIAIYFRFWVFVIYILVLSFIIFAFLYKVLIFFVILFLYLCQLAFAA